MNYFVKSCNFSKSILTAKVLNKAPFFSDNHQFFVISKYRNKYTLKITIIEVTTILTCLPLSVLVENTCLYFDDYLLTFISSKRIYFNTTLYFANIVDVFGLRVPYFLLNVLLTWIAIMDQCCQLCDNFWITQMQPEVKEVGNTARLFCSLKAYSDPNLNISFQKNHWPKGNILAKFRFPF